MSDPYVGEIRIWAITYNPYDWARCDGSILDARQFQALYAVLGNVYGGVPGQTFALPDLQGRAVIGANANGNYPLNTKVGSATVTLTPQQCPSHDHTASVTTVPGTATTPAAALMPGASTDTNMKPYLKYVGVTPTPPLVTLHPAAMANAGAASIAGHENRQPYQVLNYFISLNGEFPNFQ